MAAMLVGTGRKDWERVTHERGYRFGWLTMVKTLDMPRSGDER